MATQAPSPLMGEGRGGGENHCALWAHPHPYPPPQGGREIGKRESSRSAAACLNQIFTSAMQPSRVFPDLGREPEFPLTTTTSTYLTIENNLASYQKLTADQPAVKTATDYYQANIGAVTSIDQFVSNYRLLSYALQAYGLGDQINNTALIKQVLEQGTSSSKALANTLPNQNWKAFANAFNFSASGASSPTSSSSVATTVADYTEQQLEANEGQSDPGVQLALYFQRVAPTVTSGYGILADQNLLEVEQTIFNLPSTFDVSKLDSEATELTNLAPLSELQNPTKLNQLVERFTAAYDAKYGPGSNSSSSLTVVSDNASSDQEVGAETVLSDIASSNYSELNGLEPTNDFSVGLLSSLQGLTLGG